MSQSNIFKKIINFLKRLFSIKRDKNQLIHIMVDDKIVGTVRTVCIKKTNNINEATLYRSIFDKNQIKNAFYSGTVSEKTQHKPLQILIGDDDCNFKLNNCWIETKSPVYMTEDYHILDKIEIEYEGYKSKK